MTVIHSAEVAIGRMPTPRQRAASSLYSGRERDDGYGHVIAQINDQWRVIVCKDGIQWVLQRRDAEKPHRGFWRGRRYHATRKDLIASCVALAGLTDGRVLAILARLPETHPGRGRYD
jgi:hypothetical protein